MIKYYPAEDIKKEALNIIEKLNMNHIDLNSVFFFRSQGSKSRGTIARCHALGKLMQKALQRKAAYIIEVISERFDKMSEEDKTKTIIHELMHIPKSFGGGFKHHDYVCKKEVDKMYKRYKNENNNQKIR